MHMHNCKPVQSDNSPHTAASTGSKARKVKCPDSSTQSQGENHNNNLVASQEHLSLCKATAQMFVSQPGKTAKVVHGTKRSKRIIISGR